MAAGIMRLAIVVVCLVVGGLLVGFSGAPSAPADERHGVVTAAVASVDGQAIYLQSCASCHGPQGEGTPNGPPLTDAGPAALDFYMATGRMPLGAPDQPVRRQDPALTPEQIAAVIAYAARFGEGPDIPQVTTAGADLPLGWRLFVNDCAACHGPSGAGGAVGADVTAPSLDRADPVTVGEAVLIGPGAMPAFSFDDEQLDAVAAYVEYLRSQPSPGGLPLGGLGPVPEGFVAVIVGLGVLVLITRFVARGRLP